ncbi:hypothetical protein EVAR_14605_1 [Eumeta japonica]|uniref:Uncharacterized protein n=1 Tax=Eumeta variegata TaxID=151549 RepID=A0A4C1UVR1_EUMVA|nr:hypothetical protein EVAR_14605_1 [Eumeta japonica]
MGAGALPTRPLANKKKREGNPTASLKGRSRIPRDTNQRTCINQSLPQHGAAAKVGAVLVAMQAAAAPRPPLAPIGRPVGRRGGGGGFFPFAGNFFPLFFFPRPRKSFPPMASREAVLIVKVAG